MWTSVRPQSSGVETGTEYGKVTPVTIPERTFAAGVCPL
jgi:hypothetical protein